MRLILGAEDLAPGMFITVHRGRQATCPWGCGGTGDEAYERLKGMPLVVRGICLPYVAATIIPVGIPAVIDIRECELMRVDDGYLRAFMPRHFVAEQQQAASQPTPATEQPQQPPTQQPPP